MALQIQATTLPDEGFAKLIIRAYENPDSPWLLQLGARIDHYRSQGKTYDQISHHARDVTSIEAGDWDALMQLLDEQQH
jgi:hypothetical protein